MDAIALHLSAWPEPDLMANAWRCDGHRELRQPSAWLAENRRYAEHTDYLCHGRDHARRQRLRSALDSLASSALADYEPAQQLLLGRRDIYRSTAAYSRQGRLVHSPLPDLVERFRQRQACLATASCPLLRAALRYLELIFLHPFIDGNARAARILLEAELNGSNIALAAPLEVLLSFPKRPGDRHNNLNFVRLVERACTRSQAHGQAGGVHVA